VTFDYSAYYRRPQELKQLQIPAAAIRWIERWEPPDRPHEIVLYLGCNILRTPDVAADVVAVFEALGLDFVAVAGVQFCCGITWDRHDDVLKGQGVAETTVDRLASFGPSLVIHWCPSCDVHFSDVVTGRDQRAIPFRVTSAAAFLAELAAAGRIPWRQPVRHRAALHGHVGRIGHRHGQRRAREDTQHVSAILGSVPGIELIGVVDSPPELDYDCGPSAADLPLARWRELRAEGWAALRATGADLVVTKSHACQREWCDLANDAIEVRCYISLVADGLGVLREYPSNLLADLKRAGEPGPLVQLTRANWASHGWSESEARATIARYDWARADPDRPAP
jgi:hypothetical protein